MRARSLPPSGRMVAREARRASPDTKRMRAASMWESSGNLRTMSATTRRHSSVALGRSARRARTLGMGTSGASALTSAPNVARAKVSTPRAVG